MRILYVSQYFPPEMGAPAVRVHELAREWVRAGHEVTVLTGFPNHPTGEVHPEYRGKLWRGVFRERIDGIDVVRTWLVPLPNRKNWERFLNYGSFCLSASVTGQFLTRPDVVIATSPQLLCGLAGSLIVGRGTPFVFEVRDLWPESLISLGKSSRQSWLYRTLDGIADRLYTKAAKIVAVSEAIARYIVEKKGISQAKVAVVENGVDEELFRPALPDPEWRSRLARNGQVVFSYIGTHGNAVHLWTVLEAAKKLQSLVPQVRFALVGEGAERKELEQTAKRERLENVEFYGEQPRSEVPKIVNASDVCMVLLRKDDVFKTVIPSKMLEFMACGRPVLLGVDGQARQILDAANAGMFVEPQNPDALADAVRQMIARRSEWEAWGDRGAEYIRANFSRKRKAHEYLEILRGLVESERAEGSEKTEVSSQ